MSAIEELISQTVQLEKDIKYYQEKLKRDGSLMSAKEKDELNAKIISLGAAVDAASQTIELKAQFNEKYESLIPGMSGIVKF